MNRRVLALIGAVVIAGCSFAPKYERPDMRLPETFTNEEGKIGITGPAWWEYFDDGILDLMVQEALKYNKDIGMAAARVDQASALLLSARSDRFPALQAKAEASETWIKGVKSPGAAAPFSAVLGATWEVDLFGKYRNAEDSARAQLLSAIAAREGVRLSVAGQAAKGYFTLKSLDKQLQISKETVRSRAETVAIYQERYDRGFISELDLSQMKASLETARTTLFRVRIQRDEAEAALMILLGRSPYEIMNSSLTSGRPLEQMKAKPIIPAGLPSALLERRPDIRQAEDDLIAANADIGAAKAAWFPNISLSGFFGVASSQLESLFTDPKMTWGYGVNILQPILDFGKIRSGVRYSEAKAREAALNYEKTVETAFGDVRNALVSQKELQNVVDSLQIMRIELLKANSLVKLQYDRGYASYLDVLDTERSLFEAEIDLAGAESEYLSSVVNVCLALGGGW